MRQFAAVGRPNCRADDAPAVRATPNKRHNTSSFISNACACPSGRERDHRLAVSPQMRPCKDHNCSSNDAQSY